jgi:hypothetical protein
MLIIKAIHSSETSVITTATRHHISEDGALQVLRVGMDDIEKCKFLTSQGLELGPSVVKPVEPDDNNNNNNNNNLNAVEGRSVARMGETRNAYRLLVGKPAGKRPLGRQRCRWVDNIKMDLVEIGWGGVDWIGLVQDRDSWRALVNTVLNLLVL